MDYSTALSGLIADSTSLDTIANNLTNMSTTGYKESTTNFASAFYEALGTNGSGDTIQAGTGVTVASTSTDFTSGTLATATDSTDMAVDGSGFFVLNNNGTQLLTRDGDFSLSSTGTLESASGYAVEGYAAKNGVVDTSKLTDITIPTGTTIAATATSTVSFTQNLSSSTAVGGTTTGTETIYDSQGASYTATVTYTKTGTNEWSYSVSVPETLTASTSTDTSGNVSDSYSFGSANGTTNTVNTGTSLTITAVDSSGTTTTITEPTVTSGETLDDYVSSLNTALSNAGITSVTATNDNGVLKISETSSSAGLTVSGSVIQDLAATNATGTMTFDSSGNLTSPTDSVSDITFSGLSDGAADFNITWDLTGSTGTSLVTQSSSTSTTSASTQNGYATGTYESFTVATDGTVTATYSNGETQTIGQVAIATVTSEEGLLAVGSTDYAVTSASGAASIGVAGTDARGTIEDDELEASNVSISSEFADLIVAQRSFEADSKSLTTMDAATEDTIQIIK